MNQRRPGPPRQPRFPVAPLLGVLTSRSNRELARTCGLSARTVQRYLRTGVPLYSADVLAIRAGMHPSEVWPEWFGEAS